MTDTTTSEVERLAAKLAEWSETPYEGDPMIDALLSGVPEAAATLRDLAAERDRLREALAFYADISDYPAPLTGGMGKLYFDCGQTARAALEESK